MEHLSYNHPEFNRIKDEVSILFDREFNFQQLDNIKILLDNCEYENIQDPSFEIQAGYWLNNYQTDDKELEEYSRKPDENYYSWLEEKYCDEISDCFQEAENYPMWNTLFEAKNNMMSEWIEEHVDELYKIGIGVMLGGDCLNNMLFMSGCGYDFYEAHWIPLFTKLFTWVKIDTEITQ